jgi:hypothetical protein
LIVGPFASLDSMARDQFEPLNPSKRGGVGMLVSRIKR